MKFCSCFWDKQKTPRLCLTPVVESLHKRILFHEVFSYKHPPTKTNQKKRIIFWSLENKFAYGWKWRITTSIPNCIQQLEKHCFPKFAVAENREITGMAVAGRERGNPSNKQKLPLVGYFGGFSTLGFFFWGGGLVVWGFFPRCLNWKMRWKEKKYIFHFGTFNEKTEHLGSEWKLL